MAATRRVRTAGDALGGASPRRTTCPCPRRRPESEVLVGCSAASVSEASLAFYCVERSKQSQSGDTQRRYTTRHPDFTTEGPGWMWVRVPTRSDQVKNLLHIYFKVQTDRVVTLQLDRLV